MFRGTKGLTPRKSPFPASGLGVESTLDDGKLLTIFYPTIQDPSVWLLGSFCWAAVLVTSLVCFCCRNCMRLARVGRGFTLPPSAPPCPMPHAPCPMLHAPCPMPYALQVTSQSQHHTHRVCPVGVAPTCLPSSRKHSILTWTSEICSPVTISLSIPTRRLATKMAVATDRGSPRRRALAWDLLMTMVMSRCSVCNRNSSSSNRNHHRIKCIDRKSCSLPLSRRSPLTRACQRGRQPAISTSYLTQLRILLRPAKSATCSHP